MSKSNANWARYRAWGWLVRADRLVCRLWMITKDGVKRIMRRRVKPRFWGFLIAVTMIVFLASFAVMRVRYGYGARLLAQAQSEKDALAAEAGVLKERLDYAQTDEYVMRIARDELNMIMPGEIRYVNAMR